MLLPLLITLIATFSSAVAVYGTLPQWALYEHGMQVIEITRRLQWPLLTVSILLCLTLAVLVITGKRRIWWMVGFAPVLALFTQLFVSGTINDFKVIEQPEMALGQDAKFLPDDEFVVGVVFNDQPYAFPYRQLFHAPVILLADREKKMCLLWSAYANRALAFHIQRFIHAHDLDIVSMPANALLVYNARVGQFINGVTGLTPEGEIPLGLRGPIATTKTTWRLWRAAHPASYVMKLPVLSTAIGVPAAPQFPMRSAATTQPAPLLPVAATVVVFPASRPVAIAESRITNKPINLVVGEMPLVLFRDPVTGRVKVFERKLAEQTQKFLANPSIRRASKGVFMLDVGTNSGWTTAGVAVDGEQSMIGKKLTPVTNYEEGLYYGVMREWYPAMELLEP